jgi:hypothetical protein
MTAAGALLQIQNGIAGTGALDVGSGGTVLLATGADSGQTVDFVSSSDALDLTTPAAFAGMIEGFTHGDLIDLKVKSATSLSFANGTLTVKNGATPVASLHFAGSYTTNGFHLSSDGHNGTLISQFDRCDMNASVPILMLAAHGPRSRGWRRRPEAR